MITKTFTATIGVGAGTAYIRPALLDLDISDNMYQQTPLHVACGSGKLDMSGHIRE